MDRIAGRGTLSGDPVHALTLTNPGEAKLVLFLCAHHSYGYREAAKPFTLGFTGEKSCGTSRGILWKEATPTAGGNTT
jgi:hypothetical protein